MQHIARAEHSYSDQVPRYFAVVAVVVVRRRELFVAVVTAHQVRHGPCCQRDPGAVEYEADAAQHGFPCPGTVVRGEGCEGEGHVVEGGRCARCWGRGEALDKVVRY